MFEEADTVLVPESIKQAFYQQVYRIDESTESYDSLQLRYSARALRIDPPTPDPDGDITEIKWLEIDRLAEYLTWGQTVPFIVEIVKKYCQRSPASRFK